MYIKLAFVAFSMLGTLTMSSFFGAITSASVLIQLVFVLILPGFYAIVLVRNQHLLWLT